MFTLIEKVIKTGVSASLYPLEPTAVDKSFHDRPEYNPQQHIGYVACMNACLPNTLTVETDLVTSELAWQFNLGCYILCAHYKEVCPIAAIKLLQGYELAVWRRDDFLQQPRLGLCNCRVCDHPLAAQKETDYTIALLKYDGDTCAESHRENSETCSDYKRQKCPVPSDRIELTRHMKEASR